MGDPNLHRISHLRGGERHAIAKNRALLLLRPSASERKELVELFFREHLISRLESVRSASVPDFRVLPLVKRDLLGAHVAGEDDAVLFPVGPEDGEDATVGDGFAEIEEAAVYGVGVLD